MKRRVKMDMTENRRTLLKRPQDTRMNKFEL